MIELCAVVPVFDHERAIGGTVASLRRLGLDVILVDDGSGAACAAELDRLAALDPAVRLERLPANRGKGAAVTAGLRAAARAGYTHALQIDADGQHDATALPQFIAAAQADPDAMICGEPVFDASIPRHRLYLRYLTHVMVWINTLSLDIRDSMCGLRVYPLATVLAMLDAERTGARMDFDVETLVRLHWRGVRLRWLPVGVGYPVDGVSHFRLVEDNWRITLMHTRLFFGMLARAPRLVARRVRAGFGRSQGVVA
jgi:glycosyltransferase involved in cell wall biosynthesis